MGKEFLHGGHYRNLISVIITSVLVDPIEKYREEYTRDRIVEIDLNYL